MRINEETEKDLSLDDRIKALLFQYVKLYERWAEDRQEFTNGMARQEEMLEEFTQKIGQFEELEPKVRQQLIKAISSSLNTLTEGIGKDIGSNATAAVNQTAKNLKSVVNESTQLLRQYQEDIRLSNTYIVIMQIIGIGIAIGMSFLLGSFLLHKMPAPMVPLDKNMLQTYVHGEALEDAWQALSPRTKREIIEGIHKKTGLNPLADLPLSSHHHQKIEENSDNSSDDGSE